MVVPLATPEQLPIIDITPLYKDSDLQQKAAVAAAIRNACLNTGFFYVSGPCLPQSDDIFKCMQQLFDLPEGSKAKLDANLSQLHRGYTGLGGAHNCVPDETTVKGPDNKESYLLGECAATESRGLEQQACSWHHGEAAVLALCITQTQMQSV